MTRSGHGPMTRLLDLEREFAAEVQCMYRLGPVFGVELHTSPCGRPLCVATSTRHSLLPIELSESVALEQATAEP